MDLPTFLILGIGVALGFFVQTVLGFAAALICLPILLMVADLQESIALLSIFLLIFSIILVQKNYKLMDKKLVIKMAIGGVIGFIVGIYALQFGNPEILKKLLGVFIIFYILYTSIKKSEIKLFSRLGFLFSFLGGFFSGLYSSGGPLYITYLHNKIKDMAVVRATLIGILGVTNALRVPILVYNGSLNKEVFLQSLAVLPFFLISLYLGHKFYKKIDKKLFERIFLTLLLITAVMLIVD